MAVKSQVQQNNSLRLVKQPEFEDVLEKQREEITTEEFGVLSQNLTKAIEVLTGLLDHKDDRLKRLTAKDIIDFVIRHKENEDLDKRLIEVEKCLVNKT